MRMNPYLSFKGDCAEAFAFYERTLGARPGPLFRYGGSPLADEVPPDWQDKIMHGSTSIGEQVLMGVDVVPDRYEEPRGFTLSIEVGRPEEAERIFRVLADGGRVIMPLQETFWAERFGMLVDRFGVPWQVNCGRASVGA